MHRIPELVALPDQIERLARTLEGCPLTDAQIKVIEGLRAHAIALAMNVEFQCAIACTLPSPLRFRTPQS